MKNPLNRQSLLVLGLGALLGQALASEKELNIYSARHYQADEALYEDFTRQTGIKINRIEGKAHELLERIKNEGANSPADIFLTVDAASLAVADAWGIFAPVKSNVLESRIPAHLRTDKWFGFSMRARLIIYNKRKLTADQVASYESLAAPALKGLYCSTPGGHVYNLTLAASQVAHRGEAETEQWLSGLVANLARSPRGGDTDQIKAVATGECGVAVSNSYYLVRMLVSERVEDRNLMKRVGIVWPNQSNYGTHINISGAGIVKHTRNREAAQRFLEYLASDSAQRYFANGNNEWPVVSQVTVDNEGLAEIGRAKTDAIPLQQIALKLPAAQKMLDRVGYR